MNLIPHRRPTIQPAVVLTLVCGLFLAAADLSASPGLLRAAIAVSPASTTAVQDGELPLGIVRDANGDGRAEVFLLTVESAEAPRWDLIRDSRRLFDAAAEPLSFYLEVYLNDASGLRFFSSYPMGRKVLPTTFVLREIVVGSASPFAIVVRFEEVQGSEERWTVFSEDMTVSSLALYESPRMSFEFVDINGDRRRDVVIYQQGFEAGTGFETFITWYNWNNRAFVVYRATNVVRNINEFFSRVTALAADGDLAGIAALTAPNPDARTLGPEAGSVGSSSTGAGAEPGLISADFRLADFLQPLPETSSSAVGRIRRAFDAGEGVEAVFPDILENPFPRQGRHVFVPVVRITCCAGSPLFFQARIAMSSNPFARNQFFFLPFYPVEEADNG